jgi:glutaredoxin 3
VAFQDLNVMEDVEARAELLHKTGQMAVPVTVIGDEVIVGFDRARLSRALGL